MTAHTFLACPIILLTQLWSVSSHWSMTYWEASVEICSSNARQQTGVLFLKLPQINLLTTDFQRSRWAQCFVVSFSHHFDFLVAHYKPLPQSWSSLFGVVMVIFCYAYARGQTAGLETLTRTPKFNHSWLKDEENSFLSVAFILFLSSTLEHLKPTHYLWWTAECFCR